MTPTQKDDIPRKGAAKNVVCVSSRHCRVMTALDGGGRFETTVIAGRKVSTKEIPVSATGNGLELEDLSCRTVGTCVAAGSVENPNGLFRAAVLTLNGGRWTRSLLPVTNTSVDSGISGISCPSAKGCAAVGDQGNGPYTMLAESLG